MQKHEFAIFFPDQKNILGRLKNIKDSFVIDEPELLHRIVSVLKLDVSDQLILFSKKFVIRCTMKAITKKMIEFEYRESVITTRFQTKQHITVYVPLLKKDALETTVYNLVELGVSRIHLIKTMHSRTIDFSHHDIQRLEKIIVAAMEQAKHFQWPYITYGVMDLPKMCDVVTAGSRAFFADIDGNNIFFEIQKLDNSNQVLSPEIHLFAGPEGGLDPQEVALLMSKGWVGVHLTMGILRAWHALTLLAGFFCVHAIDR